ncbi:MAG: cytosine deaminase [Lachnospiraceae bacterium]
MRILNCKLQNYAMLMDIEVEDGVIKSLMQAGSISYDISEENIDAKGCLVVPPFIEPHIHLDAVLTAGDPSWNLSGTLFEGIERWAERKDKLTREDVIDRAVRAVQMCAVHGIQFIRTHVDVTDPSLTALKALIEVKEMVREYCEIQIVAFPQEGILSYDGGKELMKEAVALGVDVIGAIPHYEFTREYGVDSLKFAMELAKEHDLLVDVHCDEIDDEQSRFLETLAAEAIRLNLYEKVTASHTCAMGSYNDAYARKLFNVLKKSKVNFVCCAVENIHLQGRTDSYPKRRGVTRVKELVQAGINVSFAEDSIVDPWYPFGNGHILNVLFQCLHITQLMGYDEFKDALKYITENSAKTMQIQDHYGIEVEKPANLLILNANDQYSALRNQSQVLYSIRAGQVIASSEAATYQFLGKKYV